MMHTTARVISLTHLNCSVVQVLLEPEVYIDYHAGQYLQLEIGHELLSFSIANAPLQSAYYELHIRHDPGKTSHQKLLYRLTNNPLLNINVPLGNCHLGKLKQAPTVYIAGGTGFAPIKAMIEAQLAESSIIIPSKLLWLVRAPEDLYCTAPIKRWLQKEHFNYHQFFSPQLLTQYLNQSLETLKTENLKQYQFVIGGPFDMVWFIHDQLLNIGVSYSQMYSDAFSFSQEKK